MTISNIHDRVTPRSAFTLIELLMVILVLVILYGLSLTSIRAVSRHIHRTATYAELKSIETAWKQYYAHYQQWPTNSDGSIYAPTCIDNELAKVLQGTEDAGSEPLNPDKIIFMEFARLTKNNTPLNVWGTSNRFYDDKKIKDDNQTDKNSPCFYYVAFDTDEDHFIELPANDELSPTGTKSEDRNKWRALDVFRDNNCKIDRGVIVWTYDPELGTDNPDYLIGSWQ